jgi:spermidine synthase
VTEPPAGGPPPEPEVLERVTTPRGELVLRRVGPDLEVISNGVFLMDTRDGRSERALVSAALEACPGARSLLVGGLGVGFSLLEAVTHPELQRIVVVENEPTVVGWHATHLRDRTSAALADRRVEVVVADVREHLVASPSTYDAVCLDVDNGPDWTVTEANASLYDAEGVAVCIGALAPGGVLAVWSANRSPSFKALFRQRLDDVVVVEVEPLTGRGGPDVVYVGRAPAHQAT